MDNGSDNEEKKYVVGYGKPPANKQWRKGVSGNPRGAKPKNERARTNLQFWDDLLSMLEEMVPITVGGKQKLVSKHEVLLRALFNKAISGDRYAARMVIDLKTQAIEGHTQAKPELIRMVEQLERSLAQNTDPPSADDIKLFNKFRRKTRGKE